MTRSSVSLIEIASSRSTCVDVHQVLDRGPLQLGQPAEVIGDGGGLLGRQAMDPVEQAQPLRGDLLLEVPVVALAVQRRCGAAQVEHLVVGEARHLGLGVDGRAPRRQVVGDDEVELVVDVAVQLVQLQAQQPGVDAELDDHRLDLVADPVHHLAALHDGDDVTEGHDVLQLDAGEVGDGVVEAHLVALQRLQRLVGPIEQAADVLQLVLGPAAVDVDDAHLLARRHHRHAQRAGRPARPCGGGCRSRWSAPSGRGPGGRWPGRCGCHRSR